MRLRGARLLISALAVLCFGHEAVGSSAAAIVYTTKTIERHDPSCSQSAPDCRVHIRFRFPVIGRAPSAATAAAINRAINDFLLTSVGEPKKYSSVAAKMEAFMQEAAAYTKAYPGTGYSEDRIVSVLYQANGIFGVQFDLSWFFGTAHPNYTRTFANFSVRTGRQITLADVLVTGYRSRLTRMAESQFRTAKGLTPDGSLEAAGYTFPNDVFALNDNFAIGPKGITFYYNPYEIASYADGPTELLLTYGEIRALLKPNGLLGRFR